VYRHFAIPPPAVFAFHLDRVFLCHAALRVNENSSSVCPIIPVFGVAGQAKRRKLMNELEKIM